MPDERRENDDAIAVRDNVERGRFEIELEGATAFLEYTRGPAVMALVHTEVPSRLAGRGLADMLARHALEAARELGLEVDPQCPFLIGWLDRHPAYADVVRRRRATAADDAFWL